MPRDFLHVNWNKLFEIVDLRVPFQHSYFELVKNLKPNMCSSVAVGSTVRARITCASFFDFCKIDLRCASNDQTLPRRWSTVQFRTLIARNRWRGEHRLFVVTDSICPTTGCVTSSKTQTTLTTAFVSFEKHVSRFSDLVAKFSVLDARPLINQ